MIHPAIEIGQKSKIYGSRIMKEEVQISKKHAFDRIEAICARWIQLISNLVRQWQASAISQINIACCHRNLSQLLILLKHIEGMDVSFTQGMKNMQHLYLSFNTYLENKQIQNRKISLAKSQEIKNNSIAINSINQGQIVTNITNSDQIKPRSFSEKQRFKSKSKSRSKSKKIDFFASAKRQTSNPIRSSTFASSGFASFLSLGFASSTLNKTLKKTDLASTFVYRTPSNTFSSLLERSKSKAQYNYQNRSEMEANNSRVIKEIISRKKEEKQNYGVQLEQRQALERRVDELEIRITHKIDEFIQAFKNNQDQDNVSSQTYNHCSHQRNNSKSSTPKQMSSQQNSLNAYPPANVQINCAADQQSLIRSNQSPSSSRRCAVVDGKTIKSKHKSKIVKNITEKDEEGEECSAQERKTEEKDIKNASAVQKMAEKKSETKIDANSSTIKLLQERTMALHNFIEIGEKVKLPITQQLVSIFSQKLREAYKNRGFIVPSALFSAPFSTDQMQKKVKQPQIQSQFLTQCLAKMYKLLELKCGEEKKSSIIKYIAACLRCIRGEWTNQAKSLSTQEEIKQEIEDLRELVSR